MSLEDLPPELQEARRSQIEAHRREWRERLPSYIDKDIEEQQRQNTWWRRILGGNNNGTDHRDEQRPHHDP